MNIIDFIKENFLEILYIAFMALIGFTFLIVIPVISVYFIITIDSVLIKSILIVLTILYFK